MALKKKGTPEKIKLEVTEADLDRWSELRVEPKTKEEKPEKKGKK